MKKAGVITFGVGVLVILMVVVVGYRCYSDVVFSVKADEKRIALTYDDGPHPVDTPALLNLLDELDVKATFFLSGKNVSHYPGIVEDIYHRGHGIGNHGWTHQPLWHFRQRIPLEEVTSTNEAIKHVIGVEPAWFRPPYLVQGVGLASVVRTMPMVSIGATATGFDWKETDPERIAASILKSVDPGGIIVLHDGDGDAEAGAEQNSRAPTVAATAIIVRQLQEEGYRFVSLRELLAE